MRNFIFFILSLSLIILIIGCNKEQDILTLNLKEYTELAFHIHPLVEIEILGENYQIPTDIGINDEGMKVIHTHGTDGKLHIESPYAYQFHLKDFFTVWGENFNKTCVIGYCEDENHSLSVYVNGVINPLYEDIPLRDLDKIKIVYKEKE